MDLWVTKVIAGLTPGGVGIWFLVVMIGIYLIREWRETRKLSLEDRIARRDGYARQVEVLLKENREQRDDMREHRDEMRLLREEYDAHRRQCQLETDQLRHMVIELEGKVEGLNRRVATDAIELAKLKGGNV